MSTSSVERSRRDLEPVRKSVSVGCSPQTAFDVFTGRIASWWPLGRYSISLERARRCGIEPRVGGGIYEVRDDGERLPWGEVLVWDPPGRFVMTWHPGRDPETAQEVEVRFQETAEGTLVELEHRDWEKLGEDAEKARESYAGGWAHVLGECFLGACRATE